MNKKSIKPSGIVKSSKSPIEIDYAESDGAVHKNFSPEIQLGSIAGF